MAVTKIHPIKSTLKKALDYIENPDKTDEKLFVSSYGCSYETADIEFQMLLDQVVDLRNKAQFSPEIFCTLALSFRSAISPISFFG